MLPDPNALSNLVKTMNDHPRGSRYLIALAVIVGVCFVSLAVRAFG
jgi:hypothetical protein